SSLIEPARIAMTLLPYLRKLCVSTTLLAGFIGAVAGLAALGAMPTAVIAAEAAATPGSELHRDSPKKGWFWYRDPVKPKEEEPKEVIVVPPPAPVEPSEPVVVVPKAAEPEKEDKVRFVLPGDPGEKE